MSLELRKGTWPWRERRAAITSPRADSDLLMCCASRRRLPSAPDFPTRSEPAKSTRFSFPVGRALGRLRPPQWGGCQGCSGQGAHRPHSPVVRRPVLQSTPRTVTMSRACERELCSFRLVNSVVRLVWPNSNTWGGGGRHVIEA